MNLAGRSAWVRFVLTAIPIYILIALNVPKWFLNAIDKLRRDFLWCGRKAANGGCCLVSWEKVQRPIELGGLGILNLQYMSWALQLRWLWYARTDPSRPWTGLEITINSNAAALFKIALDSSVGNDANTFFWTDKWFLGSL
ncbi:hypothetical protein PR202_ga24430 [Eleusine coracana subsp. coracana]|uniref:Uncharacterized protein n=1 Tax=Eleusine coracana subsp. coracana TaxID=191504 RepID=A0AAV5D8C9_ELECO|nr:hypothetical protein PR202_ga24430 [Eleusine coracana subsp. coracana]